MECGTAVYITLGHGGKVTHTSRLTENAKAFSDGQSPSPHNVRS